MRFPQFDHLDQSERDLYRSISEVMARHLNATDAEAASLAEGFISHGLLNTYQVFGRARDIAAMKRVSAAILEISRAMSDASMGQLAQDTLHQAITFGPFFEKMMNGDNTFSRQEFDEFLHKTGAPDIAALTRIETATDRLRKGVEAAIQHVEKSPYARTSATRINTQAVGIVAASAFIWEIAGKKPPPKALNDESPFATFLRDIFEIAGVEAQPVPAFNAWKKERKQVHTSQEKIAGSVHDE